MVDDVSDVSDDVVRDDWLLNSKQPTYYPIRDIRIEAMVEKQFTSVWFPREIQILPQERDVFKTMPETVQKLLSSVLAFFASSDSLVASNLVERFQQDVTNPQAQAFYSWQNAMEMVHSRVYGDLINALIEDPKEQIKLFNAIQEVESVKKKGEWVQKWMNADAPFRHRVIAFVLVEGLFFQGSFAIIFYLKQTGYEMPGLFQSNEFISRDEEMHCEFAKLMYNLLHTKCTEKEVHGIISEAVECEREFMIEALPIDIVGMNQNMMAQYIEYTADNICIDLGVSRLFNTKNPFLWMESLALEGKTNFFERRPTDYQRPVTEALSVDTNLDF